MTNPKDQGGDIDSNKEWANFNEEDPEIGKFAEKKFKTIQAAGGLTAYYGVPVVNLPIALVLYYNRWVTHQPVDLITR